MTKLERANPLQSAVVRETQRAPVSHRLLEMENQLARLLDGLPTAETVADQPKAKLLLADLLGRATRLRQMLAQAGQLGEGAQPLSQTQVDRLLDAGEVELRAVAHFRKALEDQLQPFDYSRARISPLTGPQLPQGQNLTVEESAQLLEVFRSQLVPLQTRLVEMAGEGLRVPHGLNADVEFYARQVEAGAQALEQLTRPGGSNMGHLYKLELDGALKALDVLAKKINAVWARQSP